VVDSDEHWEYCSNCGRMTPGAELRLHQERCLGVVVCRECYERLNGIIRRPSNGKGCGDSRPCEASVAGAR
jgi:ribosomal protein L34E